MRNRGVLLSLAVPALYVSCAFGQATATGAIVGVVSDASGAAVSGAGITAINKATNAQRTTTTNGAGEYRFDLLPAGDYIVRITASGFNATDTQVLPLQVGATLTANVPLAAGTVTTTVESQRRICCWMRRRRTAPPT